ncbi:MAG: threonine synthase [Veillonellaceae bacterium]|nr:threonine synthase [Veillonellaceae bacterium]
MSNVTGLSCIHCGKHYTVDEVDYYCPDCGYEDGILDVEYDYEAAAKEMNPAALRQSRAFSMWRYLPLLPVEDPARIQHLQVGWTPVYDAVRLAADLGVARLFVKDEGRNPTASFKDRASAMGVVKALEKGADSITCASTGNAASSLAGFAAAAGLPATIFVPERAPQAKVAQLLVFGARVFAVKGTYDQAWELCMEAAAEFGWYNRNCAINPYLIEGKKTVSVELVDQLIHQYNGEMPDWVVVSVGDGCTVGGVWKGLVEMYKLGFLPRLPKVLGVQAAGCQPFLTAWKNNTPLQPTDADTLADSIAVGHPRNFRKGMKAIVESGGAFISVTDEEILDSIRTLARKAAVFGEPAGVAGVAGVRNAVKQGVIAANETVALLITGNGLKDIQSAIKAAGAPTYIEPELTAVKAALAGCGK